MNHNTDQQKSRTVQSLMRDTVPTYVLVLLGVFAAANVLILGAIYLNYPGYVDTGEPNIVALGWRLLSGNPVYLPLDDAIRTTNVYGPYLYLVHAALFWIAGASVALGKLPGILALVASFIFLVISIREAGKTALALGLALMGAIVALNLPMTVWDRPETFMMMSVSVAIWLNTLDDKRFRIVGYGCLIGFAMGMKVFAAIYFLPLGLVMLYRDGVLACALTVVLALFILAIPFLSPIFEFGHMMALVELLSGKPNSLEAFTKILRYALYYVIPVVIFFSLGWRGMSPQTRKLTGILSVGLAIAMILVLYPAQKPGAGMYYFVPFTPLAAFLAVQGYLGIAHRRRADWVAISLIVVLGILSVPSEKRFIRSLDWATAEGVAAEIEGIAAKSTGKSIEIGIGDSNESYRRTFQRTRLVFGGHPYSLDTSIVIETTAWGIELKPATIALISDCASDIWLIPAGERPFDWIGYYGNDIYGPAFREAFEHAYEKTEQRNYFDVYSCRS